LLRDVEHKNLIINNLLVTKNAIPRKKRLTSSLFSLYLCGYQDPYFYHQLKISSHDKQRKIITAVFRFFKNAQLFRADLESVHGHHSDVLEMVRGAAGQPQI
jgi:hypothetical protein